MRLVTAEVLKLRRRRGMVLLCLCITTGGAALHLGYLAAKGHALGADEFREAMAVLAMTGSVAGVILGATAGGADIEAGVYRDLAATGRSRTALLLVRVPGAWIVLAPMLLAAIAIAAVATTPGVGVLTSGTAAALASGAVTSAVCVGLAALTGSRGMVIGVALAFQLGVSPLLGQIEVLGDARWGIPQVAVARIGGDAELAAQFGLALAIGVIAAWCISALGAGLWRARTQEI